MYTLFRFLAPKIIILVVSLLGLPEAAACLVFGTTWYEIYLCIQHEGCHGIDGVTVLPVLAVFRSTYPSECTLLLVVDDIKKIVGVWAVVPSVLAASRSTDISEHTPSTSEYTLRARVRLVLTVVDLTLGRRRV